MRIDALTNPAAAPQTSKSASAGGDPQRRTAAPGADAVREETTRHSPELVTTVEAAARQIESYLKSVGRTLEFRVDAETQRTVVTVRDATSGEVIRQIPNEEVLKLANSLNDASSLLFSAQA